MPLEEMNSFFDARVKDYEEYVRQEAERRIITGRQPS